MPKVLLLDTIPFAGGSKVASRHILSSLATDVEVCVLTANPAAWPDTPVQAIREPTYLVDKQQGYLYLLRHVIIMLNIAYLWLTWGRFGKVLGCGIPSTDLAMYLGKYLLPIKLVQCIHGPVYPSKLNARCLLTCDGLFYLASAEQSLQACLSLRDSSLAQLAQRIPLGPFVNGLPASAWPCAVVPQTSLKVFWAASLLKWKGLDDLLAALTSLPLAERPETHIAYITPQQIDLPVTAIKSVDRVFWHHDPQNLSQLRANSNVFVSTSRAEPFGLSILEAMAAGLCPVIPSDGAYWDQILEDGVNCRKYIAQSAQSLQKVLSSLRLDEVYQLGRAAQTKAQGYRADIAYEPIIKALG